MTPFYRRAARIAAPPFRNRRPRGTIHVPLPPPGTRRGATPPLRRSLSMSCLRILLPVLCAAAVLGAWPLAAAASPEVTARARKYLAAHEAKVRPLEVRGAEAWWKANISGSADDFRAKEDAQNQLDAALADRDAFKEVKALKESLKEIDDAVLARAIQVIYLAYLEKQVDPELLKKIVAKSNAVEKAFNEFRPKIDGKESTDNK